MYPIHQVNMNEQENSITSIYRNLHGKTFSIN